MLPTYKVILYSSCLTPYNYPIRQGESAATYSMATVTVLMQ
jgi:hypothetical protein